MGKLTALKVKSEKRPGKYDDGDGLRLVISADGSKKWTLRIQVAGRRREFGCGSAANVTLAEARDKADEIRRMVRDGLDPKAERRRQAFVGLTFEDAARLVHKEREHTWRNEKHGKQWLSTLEQYAFPKIGNAPIATLDASSIRDVLLSVWTKKPETARRVRQRIVAVCDWAHSAGIRETEGPRSLSAGLPRQTAEVKHFAALPFADMPKFMAALRSYERTSAVVRLAVEWTVLTVARSGETRGATWDEIDEKAGLWVIPSTRMKAGRQHEVPLSSRALLILKELRSLPHMADAGSDLIFPGFKPGARLSDMTMAKVIKTMGYAVTVHGFRSAFSDWAAELTDVPNEVVEACLAHTDRNKVRRAYLRTSHLEKRRELLNQWCQFCVGELARR